MIVMHGNRATCGPLSCTVSVHVGGLHHARVGVQHKRPNLARVPCNTPCTPVGATQDNHYRTTNPVMHYVQDGPDSLPQLFDHSRMQLNHRGNQQTAHAEQEDRMSLWLAVPIAAAFGIWLLGVLVYITKVIRGDDVWPWNGEGDQQ
jgi:hypothetical protein